MGPRSHAASLKVDKLCFKMEIGDNIGGLVTYNYILLHMVVGRYTLQPKATVMMTYRHLKDRTTTSTTASPPPTTVILFRFRFVMMIPLSNVNSLVSLNPWGHIHRLSFLLCIK